jgi:uncharacterized protein (TIGR03437 family)
MDFSVLRRHGSTLFALTVALTAGSHSVMAANLLTATPSAPAMTCNTATGTTPVAIVVKPVAALSGTTTIAVTFAALSGGLTVSPASATLNSTNGAASGAGVTFTVSFAAGCVSVANAATPAIQFKAGGTNDVSVTVTTTLVSSATGLTTSPSAVTVTCVANGGNSYTPGPAQTVNVFSTAANVGSPYTITTSGSSAPATWLNVVGAGGTATTSTAVPFTVQAISPCNSLAAGTTSTTSVQLVTPGANKTVTVTLQALNPSPLTAIPAVTLTYVKGSGSPGKSSVNVASVSVPNAFFAVDTTSLPNWLTVDYTSGSAPKTIQFSSTTLCDSLAPGTYTTTVRINVSGYGSLNVSVSILITNPAPKLSVAEGTTRNIVWTIGTPMPTPVITATSSDTPIPYTVLTGGTLAPIVAANQLSGLAYSFGTPINVSFNSVLFASAAPNTVLTGTVTLKYGTSSSIVVTFNITVNSPGSTLSSVSPATIPTASTGHYTLGLTGTGFIVSSDPNQATKVGVVQSGTTITFDPNITVTVLTASTIQLGISVNTTDTLLPFANGGSVTLGVCNPTNGACSSATGTTLLSIGSYPIISAVTSSSTLTQVSPPTLPSMATYDMVSIFGSNFCPVCTSTQILYGAPDPVLQAYPTFLSPDGINHLYVTFFAHGSSTVLGTAPLLFATNQQINLLVPSGVSGQIGNQLDLVVNYGTGSAPPTLLKSAAYEVNLNATNPGIFTIGADGQGPGAMLDQNYNLIGSTNPAGARSTATDSDIIQIYMTGLGVPDSIGDNSTAGSGGGPVYPTDCASVTTYLTSLTGLTGVTTLDGSLVNPAVLNTRRLVPCMVTAPAVTFGGQAGLVKYAGWVPGTVAGLYQINVQLPSTTASSGHFTTVTGAAPTTLTAPVQLPVVVTSNSVSSQAGVTVWVTPSLKVEPIPADSSFTFVSTGTVGVAWAGANNLVVASEGTAPYHYAVTSGLLPAGLSLDPNTGAISGTPLANTAGTYTVTVTATDSAAIPLKGTSTFVLTIAGGLYLTNSVPYNSLVFGTGHAVATTTASSGVAPYNYAITSAPAPANVTLNAASGLLSTTGTTPAGTYNITIGATDANALTGSDTFTFNVALNVSHTAVAVIASGATGALTTVSATGNTGAVAYTLDATSLARGWISIDSASGVITLTNAVSGTYDIVVTATDGTAPVGGSLAITTHTVHFVI